MNISSKYVILETNIQLWKKEIKGGLNLNIKATCWTNADWLLKEIIIEKIRLKQ
jgi:hypothetical protein